MTPAAVAGMLAGLFLALVGSSLPLGTMYANIHPDYVALLVLYWAITSDRGAGYLTVWAIGLLQDLVVGDMPGAQAIALVFMVFVLYTGISRVKQFASWEQLFFIFALLLLERLAAWLWQGWSGVLPHWHLSLLVSPALGTALWPLLTFTLDHVYQYFHRPRT